MRPLILYTSLPYPLSSGNVAPVLSQLPPHLTVSCCTLSITRWQRGRRCSTGAFSTILDRLLTARSAIRLGRYTHRTQPAQPDQRLELSLSLLQYGSCQTAQGDGDEPWTCPLGGPLLLGFVGCCRVCRPPVVCTSFDRHQVPF